ncbi:hypothetical protein Tco_0702433 [Tanacetum coccineum]|uniref:Uncharacterized protein n=1 Tax=Tanacetum coccineum TaxID=301880 RepID=A0ABQ4XXA2_9ASTR
MCSSSSSPLSSSPTKLPIQSLLRCMHLLYLDSTKFESISHVRSRPVIKDWNSTFMKKHLELEIKQGTLGDLELQGEWTQEEARSIEGSLNVEEPHNDLSRPSFELAPTDQKGFYEKIKAKIYIISDHKKDLEDTLKLFGELFPDDDKLTDFRKSFAEMFKFGKERDDFLDDNAEDSSSQDDDRDSGGDDSKKPPRIMFYRVLSRFLLLISRQALSPSLGLLRGVEVTHRAFARYVVNSYDHEHKRTLLRKGNVLHILESEHHNSQFQNSCVSVVLPHGIELCESIKAMTFLPLHHTAPNPYKASQYTTKFSLPSGNAKIGALHNFCFNVWKAVSSFSPQLNFILF